MHSTLWMRSFAAREVARLLARPILQEYDASTVEELGMNPANHLVISLTADLGICKRHNFVEIAVACRKEADVCTGIS